MKIQYLFYAVTLCIIGLLSLSSVSSYQQLNYTSNSSIIANSSLLYVEVWGGGGAGACNGGRGGGGGGAYAAGFVYTSIGVNYTITVGTGGTGVNCGSGHNGTPSWFNSTGTIYADFGWGGTQAIGGGGPGGSTANSIGTVKHNGGAGAANGAGSGGGGGAGNETDGTTATNSTGGEAGTQFGGVGGSYSAGAGSTIGAGGASNGGVAAGGNGARGEVRITIIPTNFTIISPDAYNGTLIQNFNASITYINATNLSLTDQSGNGNTFVLGNGWSWNVTNLGYQLNSSAISSSLPISDLTNFTDIKNFTMSIFFNCYSTNCGTNTTHGAGLFAKNFGAGFYFTTSSNSTTSRPRFGIRNSSYSGESAFLAGTTADYIGTHNIIVTYSSSSRNMTLYTDGVYSTSNTVSTTNWNIGGKAWLFSTDSAVVGGNNNYFNGSISNISMYNRTLSSSEVFNLSKNFSVSSSGLVAWYPFINSTLKSEDYTTTNGVIYTNVNMSLPSVNNITVSAQNYFSNSYENYNTSNVLYASMIHWMLVTCYDSVNNTKLNTFNVTYNSTVYNTTVGSVYIPLNNTGQIILNAPTNYFTTYNIPSVSNQQYNSTILPWMKVQAYDSYNNTQLSGFVVNYSGNAYTATTYVYLPINNTGTITTWNVTNYFTNTTTTSTSSQQTNVTIIPYTVIRAGYYPLSTGILNFTINYTSYNNSNDNGSINTTNGIAYLPLFNSTYNVFIYNVQNGTINYASTNVTLVANPYLHSYNFTLYLSNTINIRVYDEKTGLILNTTNVTIYLTGNIASYNFTTNNGTANISLIQPQQYTITYSASGYNARTYLYTLANQSTATLNLYLLNTTYGSVLLAQVLKLTNFESIPDAQVEMLKKNLTGTNYYIVEMCNTDKNGECLLTAEISSTTIKTDTVYKFIIVYGGEVKLDSGDKQLASNTVTFQINVDLDLMQTFFELNSFQSILGTINNNGFQYNWTDTYGNVQTACIDVYKTIMSTTSLYNSSCSSSAAGSISSYIDNTTGDYYTAYSYVLYNTDKRFYTGQKIINLIPSGGKLGNVGAFILGVGILVTATLGFVPFLPAMIAMGCLVIYLLFVPGVITLTQITVGAIILLAGFLLLRSKT